MALFGPGVHVIETAMLASAGSDSRLIECSTVLRISEIYQDLACSPDLRTRTTCCDEDMIRYIDSASGSVSCQAAKASAEAFILARL